jgi:hypothetical protein
MSDGLLLIIACILVIFVPADVYVAYRLDRLAVRKPYIASLTGAALRSTAIAVAASLFAAVAFVSVWFLRTGEMLIPVGTPTLLLAVGTVIISLPNVYFIKVLRRFDRDAEVLRHHRRSEDRQPPGADL